MTAKILKIQIGSSRVLAGLLVLGHGIGWASIWTIRLPWALQGILSLSFTFSLIYFLWRDAWRRLPHSIIALEINADCSCRHLDYRGHWHDSVLVSDVWVNPRLSVFSLRMKNRRRICHIIVLPDAVETEAFRQLRIWLKWKCVAIL